MQQPRQMYNQGGYADMGLMAPRQNYGLGSFVKKAVRGVKKIAKSDLGKAALLYAGGAYLGGSTALGGAGGSFMSRMANPAGLMNLKNIPGYLGGRFNPQMGPFQQKPGFFGKLKSGKGFLGNVGNMFRTDSSDPNSKFSMGKLALGGLGVASLAPLFMKGGDEGEEETVVEQIDPAAQVQRAKNFYSGLGDKGVGLNFMPKKKYVQGNFYQPAADGGRIGYSLGSLVRGSGMAQPVSASMSAGDAPVMSSSGMGGMLSTLINNNPQLFKNVGL